MKRFVSSVLVMLCLSVSAVAMAEVKIWGADELKASGKIINVTQGFRDTALQPFNPTSNAKKGVMEKMNDKGVTDAFLTFEGELYEKNGWGISGKYYVVEASAFEFLEPNADNVKLIISKSNVNNYEAKVAMGILVKSNFASDTAPYLLDKIKNSGKVFNNNDVVYTVTAAYAEIVKQDGIGELRKLLKYHENPVVQKTAGKALIALGDRAVVEEFVDRGMSKNSQVIRELTAELAK